MAPARKSTERTTRSSRAGSPYAGRPSSPAPAASKVEKPTHRYGLRGMLSSLIWGSPSKKEEPAEQSEDGSDDGDEASQPDEQASAKQQSYTQRREVHEISDDEDEQDEVEETSRRFSSQDKGKGRAVPPPPPASRGFIRSSQTMGDLRSLAQHTEPSQDNSGEVNSSLARFFAEKGSTSLTAEERRRVSELLGGSAGLGSTAQASVPTALTPSFKFAAETSTRASPNASILSPAFKRAAPSSSNLSSLAAPRNGFPSGLSGSQSLSGLSSLVAAASSSNSILPSSANPRSAVSRRAASRPLYLGAGYSSQAAARRRKAQAQMNSLFNNLDSFDGASGSQGDALGTPGKRRRVDDGSAADASSFTIGGSPFSSKPASIAPASRQTSAFPSPAPATAAPPARQPPPPQPLLFASAPHLKAKFGTPARPSPLRQAAAVASPATPSSTSGSPAKQASPPRSTSRTADLMKDILGDTSDSTPVQQTATSTPVRSGPSRINGKVSTPAPEPRLVSRESLVKQPAKLSAAEVLQRTMPPELRVGSNGKPSRPKPPPVPGSARKTRAAAAAQQKADEEAAAAREAERQKERESRKTRSKCKTQEQDTPVPAAPPAKEAETMEVDATETQAESGSEATSAPKKAAFSFSSPAKPAQSQPALFSFTAPAKDPSPMPAPAKEQAKAPTSLFSFTPPAPSPSAPVVNGSSKKDAKEQALSMPSISLPAFSLLEASLSFASRNEGEDPKIKAIKAAVLETPLRELPVYTLL